MKSLFKFKFNQAWLTLAFVAALCGIGSVKAEDQPALATACVGLFGIPLRKQDIDGGNGNQNGGGLAQADFQKQMLEGVGAVKRQFETIETKFNELDKDSKKLSDDFATTVKAFESMPSQIIEMQRLIGSIQLKVTQERRSSFASGADLISGDEQLRAAFNGMIRSSLIKRGIGGVAINESQQKGAEDYARALSDAASPGSTYINAQLLPAIFSTIAEYGIWRNFDVIPVRTSSAKLIVDSTDPLMYWSAENTATTEGAPTGVQVTATINKLMGWLSVSSELLGDAEIDLTGHILRKFANATAYGLDWACLQADGGADATDGGFTGIFGGSGTAAVAVSGNVSVATLDLEDWMAAMLAIDPACLSRPTLRWIIHPQMLIRALAIKDLNGRPIFLPSTDAPAPGSIGSILGVPVLLAHGANATDGVSKKIAVIGDTMGQAVCLRNDFDFAASDQVMFKEDSVVFRARARGAAKTKKASAFGVLTTAAS